MRVQEHLRSQKILTQNIIELFDNQHLPDLNSYSYFLLPKLKITIKDTQFKDIRHLAMGAIVTTERNKLLKQKLQNYFKILRFERCTLTRTTYFHKYATMLIKYWFCIVLYFVLLSLYGSFFLEQYLVSLRKIFVKKFIGWLITNTLSQFKMCMCVCMRAFTWMGICMCVFVLCVSYWVCESVHVCVLSCVLTYVPDCV